MYIDRMTWSPWRLILASIRGSIQALFHYSIAQSPFVLCGRIGEGGYVHSLSSSCWVLCLGLLWFSQPGMTQNPLRIGAWYTFHNLEVSIWFLVRIPLWLIDCCVSLLCAYMAFLSLWGEGRSGTGDGMGGRERGEWTNIQLVVFLIRELTLITQTLPL